MSYMEKTARYGATNTRRPRMNSNIHVVAVRRVFRFFPFLWLTWEHVGTSLQDAQDFAVKAVEKGFLIDLFTIV